MGKWRLQPAKKRPWGKKKKKSPDNQGGWVHNGTNGREPSATAAQTWLDISLPSSGRLGSQVALAVAVDDNDAVRTP